MLRWVAPRGNVIARYHWDVAEPRTELQRDDSAPVAEPVDELIRRAVTKTGLSAFPMNRS